MKPVRAPSRMPWRKWGFATSTSSQRVRRSMPGIRRAIRDRIVHATPIGDMEELAARVGAPAAGEDGELAHQAIGTKITEIFP